MSGDAGQSNDRPFLDLFPVPQRSTVANAFLAGPRNGETTVPGVISYVREHQAQRLAHYQDWQNAEGIERVSYLLSMMADYPAEAGIEARWALYWELLPKARRDSIKQTRREEFAREYMAQQPPTERQLAFLKSLGHTGAVASKADASALIDRLAARR